MKLASALLLGGLAVATGLTAAAQGGSLTLPATVVSGSAFSVQSAGGGSATLYIVGPGQALMRNVQLGENVFFAAGSLYNAGHYVAILSTQSTSESHQFDVVPDNSPTNLNFLAKPSRLPVGLHDGITGAVYVFDSYRNLITTPLPVTFELTSPTGNVPARSVTTRNGAAWTTIDSTPQQGTDKLVARVGNVSSERVIRQVPGDPCGLKVNAQRSGERIQLQTDPVRDCSGNAVPDGTIVTFTEAYGGTQTTVDVPLKRGVAQVAMPAHDGATISVASGVALGNQIRLEK